MLTARRNFQLRKNNLRNNQVQRNKENYNAYMKNYMLMRYHRRRAFYIDKMGGQCIDCGSKDNLEFDHEDATIKEHAIAKIMTSGKTELLEAELTKCVLRCSDCHKEKTIVNHEYTKNSPL